MYTGLGHMVVPTINDWLYNTCMHAYSWDHECPKGLYNSCTLILGSTMNMLTVSQIPDHGFCIHRACHYLVLVTGIASRLHDLVDFWLHLWRNKVNLDKPVHVGLP